MFLDPNRKDWAKRRLSNNCPERPVVLALLGQCRALRPIRVNPQQCAYLMLPYDLEIPDLALNQMLKASQVWEHRFWGRAP